MPHLRGDTLLRKIAHSSTWGSSELDWCESNFSVTVHITEFWNTISNVPFFIIPPILIYLFREYGKRISYGVHLEWFLFIITGLGSAYFHATLSLFGQLWDEIGILWGLAAVMALWSPKDHFPKFCNHNRFVFQMVILAIIVLGSVLFTVIPGVNILMLFSFTVPVVCTFYKQHRRWSRTDISRYQAVFTLILLFVAITCWVCDKAFCDLWMKISFQYLHAVWHVLILSSAYRASVLFAYYHALEEFPQFVTCLKLWPRSFPQILAVPYVEIKNSK